MKFLLLLLCVALAQADLAPIYRSNQRSVPDSWVIKIKDFDQVEQVAEGIISRFSKMRLPTPTMTKIRKLMPVLTMKIPAFLLEEIRSIDGIEYIEQDKIATLAAYQYNPPWGLDRIDSRSGRDYYYSYSSSVQGKGVYVYIVDTGVQTSHNAFGGRAYRIFGKTDDHGHGTHCAGTAAGDVYGLAREAYIISVKVCSPLCPMSTTIEGFDAILDYAGSYGGVISVSIGGFSYAPSMTTAVNNLWNNGYLVSYAAGNENDDTCNISPQNGNKLIVAAASDENDYRASFSNWGSCVDIFAPGVNVLSAGYSTSSDSGSVYMSGTSMACPHVTGAAALHFGRSSSATPSSVKNALLNDATTNAIHDAKGTPNRLLYVNF
ncbi:uncharacterized protein LOC110980472 [Acanthaster planci]|uniref:Uncharacterized protein LOC110980472 n=1 Tax=Acanthaster planci TaxID=133434 RepID=A0A8B7YI02_ACAPL|nr:uncharacterized protein LOC110980472 [Acanthaster planci]XP_022092863.1 uncharacterized protein LOC110980472 [Acanthaster planci]